jgi:hypothetical protein
MTCRTEEQVFDSRQMVGISLFYSVQIGTELHPVSSQRHLGLLPRGYSGRGVKLTIHPHPVPKI